MNQINIPQNLPQINNERERREMLLNHVFLVESAHHQQRLTFFYFIRFYHNLDTYNSINV